MYSETNKTTREFLLEDWKQNIDGIRDKLINSQEYKNYREKINDKKHEHVKRVFTVKNIILGFPRNNGVNLKDI